MKNPRVAIYIRVSTQDQSLDLQRRELTQFAKARGWKIHKVYEDKLSGTTDKRPQLIAMMNAAKVRDFDVLLVWKLDRLFRSLKGMIATLQDLEALRITFVSMRDHIDLSTPSGRLMTHLLSSFAEFEASLIRERVVAGLKEAKRKGVKLGRPQIIDTNRVQNLRVQGKSLAEIAKALGCSKAGVFKVLKA